MPRQYSSDSESESESECDCKRSGTTYESWTQSQDSQFSDRPHFSSSRSLDSSVDWSQTERTPRKRHKRCEKKEKRHRHCFECEDAQLDKILDAWKADLPRFVKRIRPPPKCPPLQACAQPTPNYCIDPQRAACLLMCTTGHKPLCHGSTFSVTLTVQNKTREHLEQVVVWHCIGPQLTLSCGPPSVEQVWRPIPCEPVKCEAPCTQLDPCASQLFTESADGSFQPRYNELEALRITFPSVEPCGQRSILYNLRVTDKFPLPSIVTWASISEFSANCCHYSVKIQSNKEFLGRTLPAPKCFTISQPMPCKWYGCCPNKSPNTCCGGCSSCTKFA
jgi:hypothetical protein